MDINNKKVSVIMPTYNDSVSIIETFDSLRTQIYDNWELCVVDDGSTDNTKEVIEEYIRKYNLENKIRYIYQQNQDQLRAIMNGLNYITGDYIYILHSDDLLGSDDMFEKCINYMNEHNELDGIIGQFLVIDENSKLTGKIKISKYKKKEHIIANQLLWLGRNLYSDVGFFKKDVYIEKVKENYLRWNNPFWLCTNDKGNEMLNVHTVLFNFIQYRIHSGNYINNEIGKLNVINGELRTVTRIMKYYHIPFYKLQYIIFRLFKKVKLDCIYRVLYKKQETKNKSEIISFVLEKRFGDEYKSNKFLNSVYLFYKNKNNRSVNFSDIYNNEEIYEGNQMRKFNNQLLKNELPLIYEKIMKEMELGFSELIVNNKDEYEKALNLTKFMCIYPHVDIIER